MVKSGNSNNYVSQKHYGPEDMREANPEWYMVRSDRFWKGHGNHDPSSEPSREYMAEICSKNWTPLCEQRSLHKHTHVPDRSTDTVDLSEGDKHIRRTAEKKFCRVVENPNNPGRCIKEFIQVEPNSTESPYYARYSVACIMICDKLEPKDHKDAVTEKCLDKPYLCSAILESACIDKAKSGEHSENPRLNRYCAEMHGVPDHNDAKLEHAPHSQFNYMDHHLNVGLGGPLAVHVLPNGANTSNIYNDPPMQIIEKFVPDENAGDISNDTEKNCQTNNYENKYTAFILFAILLIVLSRN